LLQSQYRSLSGEAPSWKDGQTLGGVLVGSLDLVIVDYLQLMSAGARRCENRTQEVSAISRGLKTLSKELAAPVIALSQLSRDPEKRGGDHRPQLADLRESGSIEQDADVVMFVFARKSTNPMNRNLAALPISSWPSRGMGRQER